MVGGEACANVLYTIVVLLFVAVIAVAIATILLAMYLARVSTKMRYLTCKAYCRKEKQPLLPLSHRTFNLLSDSNEVEVGVPGGSRWDVRGCGFVQLCCVNGCTVHVLLPLAHKYTLTASETES